ncbi:MAG: ABC transporter ATP-binding protein [Gammaproteobacteria bacterium]|nr:ABC transporter ATP-binding protein [Gammaproteobacteria bacterium]
MTARVELRGIGHRFGAFEALADIDLPVNAGEYAVLLGPSGCGKTTLLMILAGFIHPVRGEVLIGDRPYNGVPPARRPTTTMFQDYALFPHMTVRSNIMFGPKMRGVARGESERRALELLEMVNLPGAAGKKPHELSGGQRQRVALARALAVGPDVLLLDEPLGALDLNLRKQMQHELKQIQRETGTTFIHVTHDQEEAMAIADRIVVMNHGRIEDHGPPDRVYLRPATLFSAGFMGELNRVEGRVLEAGGAELRLEAWDRELTLPSAAAMNRPLSRDQRVVLCFRPEHFRVSAKDPVVNLGGASARDVAFFGPHLRVMLVPDTAPDRPLTAHFPQLARLAPGARTDLCVNADAVVVLPLE